MAAKKTQPASAPPLDEPESAPARGGRREGSGRKAAGHEVAPARLDYDAARARNEAAKADLNELELSIKRGDYVERSAVQQATATALSSLSQSLRSVPDNLERTLGLDPAITIEVGMQIDAALDSLATQFEEITLAANKEAEDAAE